MENWNPVKHDLVLLRIEEVLLEYGEQNGSGGCENIWKRKHVVSVGALGTIRTSYHVMSEVDVNIWNTSFSVIIVKIKEEK